jgi:hypothetical protein
VDSQLGGTLVSTAIMKRTNVDCHAHFLFQARTLKARFWSGQGLTPQAGACET